MARACEYTRDAYITLNEFPLLQPRLRPQPEPPTASPYTEPAQQCTVLPAPNACHPHINPHHPLRTFLPYSHISKVCLISRIPLSDHAAAVVRGDDDGEGRGARCARET